jgi:hypothetical protein
MANVGATTPTPGTAALDGSCSYSVVVLSSAPCSGGNIQYTCGANNCFIAGTCSVSGTVVVGPLGCVASPPAFQMSRDDTFSGPATCNVVAVVAVDVVLDCGWFSNP